MLSEVNLTANRDKRHCSWEDKDGRLQASTIYRTVISEGASQCSFYNFIWKSCAPPKVKFFGWLLVQDRIQTKVNLHRKHCIDSSRCDLCGAADESSAHLVVGCPFAAEFWDRIGVPLNDDDIDALWQVSPPPLLPKLHFNAFILLCCWRLWNTDMTLCFVLFLHVTNVS